MSYFYATQSKIVLNDELEIRVAARHTDADGLVVDVRFGSDIYICLDPELAGLLAEKLTVALEAQTSEKV